MYVSPSRAWAFYLSKLRNYQSCWHTIALKRLSRCIKDRLRPDGRVSSMSNERSLDFILYLYHSGYARLYCSNKQPPNFSDVTQSLLSVPCYHLGILADGGSF